MSPVSSDSPPPPDAIERGVFKDRLAAGGVGIFAGKSTSVPGGKMRMVPGSS